MNARDRRNLNPTPEAIAAMWLWGPEYAAQNGGSMDFFDSLSLARKKHATELVKRIEAARKAHKQ